MTDASAQADLFGPAAHPALPDGMHYREDFLSRDDEAALLDVIATLPLAEAQYKPRSAYLLTGTARWGWQHSIAPTPALRYSITFRTRRRRAA